MIRVLDGSILCDTHDECIIVQRNIAQVEHITWDIHNSSDEIQWTIYEKKRHIGEENFLYWFIWIPSEAWKMMLKGIQEDCEYMKSYATQALEFGFLNDCD